jgi:hypothetical protein
LYPREGGRLGESRANLAEALLQQRPFDL